MTSLKINGVEFEINDGFIVNKKYNEELDTATITIPFSDKLNLSPFDFVEINDERFGSLYFLVDTWVEETISFNPLKYNYNINLISETIKLQKVVLPNVTITQPIGYGREKKTIGKKLEDYYGTYIYPQYNDLKLDASIVNLTELSPEEEFNRPTAFEVFNTLLAKINSIVTIKNNVISFIRLDEYGNEINEDNLYYNNNTQTIKDYANRLDVQVSNGITESTNFSSTAGITVIAGEGQAVLNDDNMLIMLEKPIYDIGDEANIYVYVPYKYNDNTGIAKLNITDKIVEKTVYDTYSVSYDNEVVGRYKRDALYYVMGNNTIEGLGYHERGILGSSTNIALYNIIRNELRSTIGSSATADFTEAQIRNNVYFLVEYKTNESFRFVVEKENDYNATLVDNQTETQVDILNFGKVEQSKINRLGNKAQIITATYELSENIPELGDYIGAYILAETEIVYYKDYCLFKGYLYKDYVRKNMFYGLSSRKRSTKISTESVVRNDVVNYDISFQTEKDANTEMSISRYILQPLSLSGYPNQIDFSGYDYYEYPKYCMTYPLDDYQKEIFEPRKYLLLNPSSFICGKSNVIQFQFMDNYSAGIKVTGDVTGGKKQEYVPYTDDYGEFGFLHFSIYTNKRDDLIENATKDNIGEYRDLLNQLPELPYEITEDKVNIQTISRNMTNILTKTKRIHKDNRETTAITINFNYKDSDNVVIGNFAQYTGIGYRYNIAYYNIGIVCSTTTEYDIGDEYGIGDLKENVVIDWKDGTDWMTTNGWVNTLDNLSIKDVNDNSLDTSNWKSWGIVEKDTGKLILGVNKGKLASVPTTIYLKIQEKDY